MSTQTIDWQHMVTELDAQGWGLLPNLLSATDADDLASLYGGETGFRSKVLMAQHGFGRGEYKYFSYPLPPLIAQLRACLYPRLSQIANRWMARLGMPDRFEAEHTDYLSRCHFAGQTRPTPLLLRYGPGDYNCMHQDIYGDELFPLQVAILLDEPGVDFDGGEFVMTEQRPRMQTRAMVVPLRKGDAVVFAVNDRPVESTRGDYRVKMRHGVSALRRGQRRTLGIIFHDAN